MYPFDEDEVASADLLPALLGERGEEGLDHLLQPLLLHLLRHVVPAHNQLANEIVTME
jgi:hypothetical protein